MPNRRKTSISPVAQSDNETRDGKHSPERALARQTGSKGKGVGSSPMAESSSASLPSTCSHSHQGGRGRKHPKHLQLYTIDQVPLRQQSNPFILTGYRKDLDWRASVRSILQLHNETGNIWTHFVGIWLFLALSVYVYTYVLDLVASHVVIFSLFMFANIFCMTSSVLYHTLNSHFSARVFEFMIMMDMLGIAVLIVACFIMPLYFAFSCHPTLRNVYTGMIAVLGGAGIIAPLVDRENKHHGIQVVLLISVVASGLAPTFHFFTAMPLTTTTWLPLGGIALMFLQYGLAVVFYLLRIPERWYPGEFDYWLNSHQIWHIGVLCAMATHFYTCLTVYSRFQAVNGNLDFC